MSLFCDNKFYFMEEGIILNSKELKRAKVMEMLSMGSLTNREAAGILELCERQVKRQKKKYLAHGEAGLIHGNKGGRQKLQVRKSSFIDFDHILGISQQNKRSRP